MTWDFWLPLTYVVSNLSNGLRFDQMNDLTDCSCCYKQWAISIQPGEQGWRSGESTCLPPMWPGSDSSTRRQMWVEFVVGCRPCSERFFPVLRFSPLLNMKPTFLNSNSIWTLWTKNNLVDVPLLIPIYLYYFIYYYYCYLTDQDSPKSNSEVQWQLKYGAKKSHVPNGNFSRLGIDWPIISNLLFLIKQFASIRYKQTASGTAFFSRSPRASQIKKKQWRDDANQWWKRGSAGDPYYVRVATRLSARASIFSQSQAFHVEKIPD